MNNKKFSLLVAVLMLTAGIASLRWVVPVELSHWMSHPEEPLVGSDLAKMVMWNNFYYGAHEVWGTYSVKGDLYIEETNNFNCGKSPMSFRYTFDGTNPSRTRPKRARKTNAKAGGAYRAARLVLKKEALRDDH
ncbi:MAG: hypothetical protein U0X92_07595 [Anaerolineales bacterium]